MLGIGTEIYRSGAPSESKLGINSAVTPILLARADDENVLVYVTLDADTAATFSANSSEGALHQQPAQLQGVLTFERIDTSDNSTLATATGTYNGFNIDGSDADVVAFSEASTNQAIGNLLNEAGSALIDLTNTGGAIDSDITTSSFQSFRVSVVLRAAGFADSESATSAIVIIPPAS